MTGGLIQLVAYGIQDIFLTQDPQITFFKVVYRRHTNFSIETIPQFFTHRPDFGKRVTCVLSRDGDLIRKMHLVVVLPRIPVFKDEDNNVDVITKFAWVRRIGYALIRRIEIEIGGELIDRQYGDWLNIWNELTGLKSDAKDKMLGDVKELTDFTNGKTTYRLFIPLQFWFCRTAGLALPVVALQYNHIKINLEFKELDQVRVLAPTHYITIDNEFVNFEPFEYIEQIVDGERAFGQFVHYDAINRRLYYTRITDNSFLGIPIDPELLTGNEMVDDATFLYDPSGDVKLALQKFLITGLTSKYEAIPRINTLERSHTNNSVRFSTVAMKDAFLLVEFIYLDMEERVRFSQSKHEYLIEQVLFEGQKTVDGLNQRFRLGFTHPCKEIIWVVQRTVLLNTRNNDEFNYTNSLERLGGDPECSHCSLITDATLIFNGEERLTLREIDYFTYVQPWQHHSYTPSEGINVYSFAIHPEKHQPSGTANLSKIDDIRLRLKVEPSISLNNTAKLRVYGVVYNILRVINGISGLVFANDRPTEQ